MNDATFAAVHEALRTLRSNDERLESLSLITLCDIAQVAIDAYLSAEGLVTVPVEPTDGLLMSMAIRSDHALGMPGYYDDPMFSASGVTHARRLEVALTEARQLHEEVVGKGFYKPERETYYNGMR